MKSLGILLDSVHLEARLPQYKFQELYKCFNEHTQLCTESRPAHRTFLRRMIDASMTTPKSNDQLSVPEDVRKDIHLWKTFTTLWNGTRSMLHLNQTPTPDLQLFIGYHKIQCILQRLTVGSQSSICGRSSTQLYWQQL